MYHRGFLGLVKILIIDSFSIRKYDTFIFIFRSSSTFSVISASSFGFIKRSVLLPKATVVQVLSVETVRISCVFGNRQSLLADFWLCITCTFCTISLLSGDENPSNFLQNTFRLGNLHILCTDQQKLEDLVSRQ